MDGIRGPVSTESSAHASWYSLVSVKSPTDLSRLSTSGSHCFETRCIGRAFQLKSEDKYLANQGVAPPRSPTRKHQVDPLVADHSFEIPAKDHQTTIARHHVSQPPANTALKAPTTIVID